MNITLRTSKPWKWIGNELRQTKLMLSVFGDSEKKKDVSLVGDRRGEGIIDWGDGLCLYTKEFVQRPNNAPYTNYSHLFHVWFTSHLREDLGSASKLWWYHDEYYDATHYRSLKLLWIRVNWTDETFCRETWQGILFNKTWPVTTEMRTRLVTHSLYTTILSVAEPRGSAAGTLADLLLRYYGHAIDSKNSFHVAEALILAELGDVLSE